MLYNKVVRNDFMKKNGKKSYDINRSVYALELYNALQFPSTFTYAISFTQGLCFSNIMGARDA